MKENALFLMLLIMFGSYFPCTAQKAPPSVVTAKDGKVYTGEILKYVPGEFVKIKLDSGGTIELEDNEIAKIEQFADGKPATQSKEPVVKLGGIYGNSMLSFVMGANDSEELSLGAGFSQVIGYQFKPFLGAGLGFGIDNYSRRGETVYPIFCEVKGFFPSKKKHAGFYGLVSGGYSLAFKRESLDILESKGGPMGQICIGHRSATIEGVDVNFDLGFRFQKAEFSRLLFNGDIEEKKINFQRIMFRVGVGFWK